jgi:hypothetical protein
MTLFPNEDALTQEIESWRGFADALREEDRALFLNMLNECYQYTNSINSKGDYFSTESLLMSLVFVQHKIINWIINRNLV